MTRAIVILALLCVVGCESHWREQKQLREARARAWMQTNGIVGRVSCPYDVCDVVPADARPPFTVGCPTDGECFLYHGGR